MRLLAGAIAAVLMAWLARQVEDVAARYIAPVSMITVLLVYVSAVVAPDVRERVCTTQQYHISAMCEKMPLILQMGLMFACMAAFGMGNGAATLYLRWGGWAAMSYTQRAVIAMHAMVAPLLVLTVATIGCNPSTYHSVSATVLGGALALAFVCIEFYLLRCEAFDAGPATAAEIFFGAASVVGAVLVLRFGLHIMYNPQRKINGWLSIGLAAVEIVLLATCSSAYQQLLDHEMQRDDGSAKHAADRLRRARARESLRRLAADALRHSRCCAALHGSVRTLNVTW